MRIGALLLVGLGVLSSAAVVGACNSTTSADLVCSSAGGVCIETTDMSGCKAQLGSQYPCDNGLICCQPFEGGVTDDAGSTTPADTGTKG